MKSVSLKFFISLDCFCKNKKSIFSITWNVKLLGTSGPQQRFQSPLNIFSIHPRLPPTLQFPSTLVLRQTDGFFSTPSLPVIRFSHTNSSFEIKLFTLGVFFFPFQIFPSSLSMSVITLKRKVSTTI